MKILIEVFRFMCLFFNLIDNFLKSNPFTEYKKIQNKNVFGNFLRTDPHFQVCAKIVYILTEKYRNRSSGFVNLMCLFS